MELIEQVKRVANLQKHATARPYFVHSEAQGDETGYTHTDHWLTPQPGPTNEAGEYNDIASVAGYADAEFFKEAGSLDFAALHAALAATPAPAAAPATGVVGADPLPKCMRWLRKPLKANECLADDARQSLIACIDQQARRAEAAEAQAFATPAAPGPGALATTGEAAAGWVQEDAAQLLAIVYDIENNPDWDAERLDSNVRMLREYIQGTARLLPSNPLACRDAAPVMPAGPATHA